LPIRESVPTSKNALHRQVLQIGLRSAGSAALNSRAKSLEHVALARAIGADEAIDAPKLDCLVNNRLEACDTKLAQFH